MFRIKFKINHGKIVDNAYMMGLIYLNSVMKRTYIPHPRTHLYIEPVSYCNLECRFCAYHKKTMKRKVMDIILFENVVNEAVDLGYTDFGLTPLTGEVFCDKNFMKKIDILEKTETVKSYHFYTNFVLPDIEIIKQILDLKKLSNMTMSIYGYDLETFKTFTQSGGNQYNSLIQNLEYLLESIMLKEGIIQKNSFFLENKQ